MDRRIRLDKTMSIAVNKGLLNAPGENNCFLNSAVQVLWHLDAFRRSFRQLSGHYCMGESCIFCALKVIFTQFQYSDEPVLPPDALRTAMAFAFKTSQRFQLGDMDDAAECFENILCQLHFHAARSQISDGCNVKHCISHQKFAMQILEQIVCKCGATSEPLPFFQLVHYVSASALSNEAKLHAGPSFPSFGELLKIASGLGDKRHCPSNCGETIEIQRLLLNFPDIVSIGLSWDSECPETEQINDVLQCLDTELYLPAVFDRVVEEKAQKSTLTLVGIVTYYGKHYSTFFFHTRLCNWFYYDDATVKEVGPHWEDLVDRCRRNKYQPLLLLYANIDAKVIDITDAPKEVEVVNGTLSKTGKISLQKSSDEGIKSSKDEGIKSSKSKDKDISIMKKDSKGSVTSETQTELCNSMVPTTSGYSVSAKEKESHSHFKRIGAALKNGISHIKRPASTSPTFKKKAFHSSKSGENLKDGTDQVDVVTDGGIYVDDDSSPNDLIDLRDQVSPRNKFKDIMMLYEDDLKNANRDGSTSYAPHKADDTVQLVNGNLMDLTHKKYKLGITREEVISKCKKLMNGAEDTIQESLEMEKNGDLHTAMILCTKAATRLRIISELPEVSLSDKKYAQMKRNTCLVKSRFLHSEIKQQEEESNPSSRESLDTQLSSSILNASQEYKDQLVHQQKIRDTKLLQEHLTSPNLQHGTFPKHLQSAHLGTEQWQQSLHQENHGKYHSVNSENSYPRTSSNFLTLPNPKKTSSYRSRSVISSGPACSQQIKPDTLCYNPVHYSQVNRLSNEISNMYIQSTHDSQPQLNKGGYDNLLHTNRKILHSQSHDSIPRNCPGDIQADLFQDTDITNAQQITEQNECVREQSYQHTPIPPPAYPDPPPYRYHSNRVDFPETNHQYQYHKYIDSDSQGGKTHQNVYCSPSVVPRIVDISGDYITSRRWCPRCSIAPIERSQVVCTMCQRGVDRQRHLLQ